MRLTGGIDVFYPVERENVARLFDALAEFWDDDAGIEDEGDLAVDGQIIQFGVPPNRIDLLNQIDGVNFEEAWPDRVVAVLKDSDSPIPVPFIGLRHLVQNKRASSRPKDLDDLEYLEQQ